MRERLIAAPANEAASLMKWFLDEAKRNESQAADLAAALTGLSNDPDVSKPLRKLARKGLFLLGKPQEEPAEADRAVVETPVEWKAWMSGVDGTGGQLLLLARPDASLTYRLLVVYAQEGRGIANAFEERMSLHELPDRVAALGSTLSAFDTAPPDYVKWRVAGAASDTREAGNRVPNAVAFWAGSLPSEEAEHPVTRLELPEVESGTEISEVLFQKPTLGWVHEIPRITPMIKELTEAAESKVEVSEDVRKSRMEDILRKATKEIFDERQVQWFERRLNDLAYLQHLAGNEDDAALARAAALDVAMNGAESKVAIALTQKTLVYFMELARRGR